MHGLYYPFSWADVVERHTGGDISCSIFPVKKISTCTHLDNMILHTYSYVAIHLRSYTHSYICTCKRVSYLRVRRYVASKATYVATYV